MDRLEIIETLKHFPDRLQAELQGLPAAALAYRPAEGEWCVREVIGHLVYLEEIWYRRLYQVWSMHDPVLVSFNAEAQLEMQEKVLGAADVAPYLEQLATMRPRIVDLLAGAVDWTRIGQWQGSGRRSLKQLAEYLVSHDADHMGQIAALKAGAGAGSAP